MSRAADLGYICRVCGEQADNGWGFCSLAHYMEWLRRKDA